SVGVYVLALVTLGINRFLLAALSAAQPRVVPRDQLLIANALTPTVGAVSTVLGAGLGFAIVLLILPGPSKDGTVQGAADALFGGASLLALRMTKDQLGPAGQTRLSRGWRQAWQDIRATAIELAQGARYMVERGTTGAALGVMALHRFLYGVNFIALILISRNLLADPQHA